MTVESRSEEKREEDEFLVAIMRKMQFNLFNPDSSHFLPRRCGRRRDFFKFSGCREIWRWTSVESCKSVIQAELGQFIGDLSHE